MLRHIEALRLFAANHDGKLPTKLADIDVALPNDPFADKAFHFEVNGATAKIEGEEMRFEIAIKK